VAEASDYRVGALRWLVYLATREQIAQVPGVDPGAGTGINEVPTDAIRVHADVQAVGALTFWAGQQVDAPITHRIFIRWVDAIPNTAVVVRQTLRRDGSVRTERFRVRRWKELGGRKRFVLLEVELEAYES
jgi:Phage head-tail joining protein